MTSAKITIAARKARWEQFYDLSSSVRFLLLVDWSDVLPERPLPNPELKAERIEWAWAVYQRQLEALDWLEDDRVPNLYSYTGTEIFAEAFGCAVHRPADNMPFALPRVSTAAEVAALPQPDLNAPALALCFEIADELLRRAGPGALMRLPDIQAPLDIAALIWDKRSFYPALLEDPAPVLELAGRVRDLQTAFIDAWLARYGVELAAHYPDYYFPRGITLSEDEVGAVSPALFERLFLPELEYLSRRYGGLGMHCCAHARHQWRGFQKIPGLKLINFVQPRPVLNEAARVFASTAGQMHNWNPPIDLFAGPAQFPPEAHLVLPVAVETRAQAAAAARLFRLEWA